MEGGTDGEREALQRQWKWRGVTNLAGRIGSVRPHVMVAKFNASIHHEENFI